MCAADLSFSSPRLTTAHKEWWLSPTTNRSGGESVFQISPESSSNCWHCETGIAKVAHRLDWSSGGYMNPTEFREVGHRVVDLLAGYLEHIEERPVFPNVEPATLTKLFAEPLPEHPSTAEEVFAELEE